MTTKSSQTFEPPIWHPDLLASQLRGKRLTLLYGAAGPWRDGMVRRGLMPMLRQHGHARARERSQIAIRFDGWGMLPLPGLRARLDTEFKAAKPLEATATLAAQLLAIDRQHHTTVLLVLDAFERHLVEPMDRPDIERFDRELAECIKHEAVPLHVLIVVDDASYRPLQRYTQWIANFGADFLRLPGATAGAGTTQWSDTDIEAAPTGARDEPAPQNGDAEWSLDLLLDDATDREATATDELPPAPAPAPAPAPVPASAPVAASAAAASAAAPTAAPQAALLAAVGAARVDAAVSAAKAAAAAPAPLPSDAPAFGAWPEIRAHAPAAPRSVPPWLTDADVETMRRMQQRQSRWPALAGLAAYLVILFAGAWIAARWIVDSNRVEPRAAAQRMAGTEPSSSSPVTPNPGATNLTAVAPSATNRAATTSATATAATTRPAAATNPAANPAAPNPVVANPASAKAALPDSAPVAPAALANTAASPRALTLALPPDAGSALPLIDEVIRRVAAPAGLELRLAEQAETAALALWRTDALLAARGTNAMPLRVVAPLFSEQVQVLVRTDARWDYLREIKGLRLNIGRADGARARTVRALYQQLFGVPLPPTATNDLSVDRALQLLLQRNGPIDAVVAVSESPLLPQLPAAMRRQVRELSIDAAHARAVTALPGFSITRRTPADHPRLSVMNFLVAPGAAPRPHDSALRTLAVALCRAQPALQAQDSPLLRGLRQGQQPAVGWPYVVPQAAGAACPA